MNKLDQIQKIVDVSMDIISILIILLVPTVLYVSYKNVQKTRKRYMDDFLKQRDLNQKWFDGTN